nr:unnamed protein product [Digitaria exilis]
MCAMVPSRIKVGLVLLGAPVARGHEQRSRLGRLGAHLEARAQGRDGATALAPISPVLLVTAGTADRPLPHA